MTAAESPHVTVARATVDALRAAQAALDAIQRAMATANQLAVVTPGWQQLQVAGAALAAIVDPHSPTRVLAENELAAAPKEPA